jgi:Resolvase, N terminal domain
MMIGYARISTDEQNLALQLDALRGAGCEVIFEDTASGADDGRKGLADAVARCAAGDVLVAWKIDRLGRSTLDLVGLVEKLKGRGVGLKVLTGRGLNRHDAARGKADIRRLCRLCGVRTGIDPRTDHGRDAGGKAPGPSSGQAAQADAAQARPCTAVDRGRKGNTGQGCCSARA